MDDLWKKVIKGLECCKTGDCSGCPYEDTSAPVGKFGTDELVACKPVLFADSLELLKSQVPHVMMPEEVEQVEEQGIVWCEYKKTNSIIPLIRIVNIFEAWDDYVLLCEVTDCDDYLKEYRFWNLHPTNAQRNATPWEPMKKE